MPVVGATASLDGLVDSGPPLLGASVVETVDVVASAGAGALPAGSFVDVLPAVVALVLGDELADVEFDGEAAFVSLVAAFTFTSVDATVDSGDAALAAVVDSAAADAPEEEAALVVTGTAAVEVLAWLAVLTGTSEVLLLEVDSAVVPGVSVAVVFDAAPVASATVVVFVAPPVEFALPAISVEGVCVVVALAVADVSDEEAASEDGCVVVVVELAVLLVAEVEPVGVDSAVGALVAVVSVDDFAAVEDVSDVAGCEAVSPLEALSVVAEVCCSSLAVAAVEPVCVVAPPDVAFSPPLEADAVVAPLVDAVVVALDSAAEPLDAVAELPEELPDSFALDAVPPPVDAEFDDVAPLEDEEDDVPDFDWVLVVPELDPLLDVAPWEVVPVLAVAGCGWNTTVAAAPIAVFAA